jgi:hydroxymethylpyrimidine/phosphomethylpyrimidine kinase
MPTTAAKPVALSIAGFDPSGAAGLLADLKTFAAHDCYGAGAATGIAGVDLELPWLKLQLDSLLADVTPAGFKVGPLGARRNAEVVAKFLNPWRDLPIVVDSAPELLLPLARVSVPSAEQAGRLLGLQVLTLEEMKGAAKLLQERGPAHVVVRGPHLDKPADVYYDGRDFEVFQTHRDSGNTAAGGCTFSAALLANLIHGKAVKESIVLAEAYLIQAIARSYPIGSGRGPLNHLFRFGESPARVALPDLAHEVPQA